VESIVTLHTPAAPGTLVVREGERRFLVSGQGQVKLDPTRDHSLTLEASGYKPASLSLTSRLSVGNFFYGLCVALPVAPVGIPIFAYLAASGAFDVLDPGNPWVALVREESER
jgi:hypothetical protein